MAKEYLGVHFSHLWATAKDWEVNTIEENFTSIRGIGGNMSNYYRGWTGTFNSSVAGQIPDAKAPDLISWGTRADEWDGTYTLNTFMEKFSALDRTIVANVANEDDWGNYPSSPRYELGNELYSSTWDWCTTDADDYANQCATARAALAAINPTADFGYVASQNKYHGFVNAHSDAFDVATKARGAAGDAIVIHPYALFDAATVDAEPTTDAKNKKIFDETTEYFTDNWPTVEAYFDEGDFWLTEWGITWSGDSPDRGDFEDDFRASPQYAYYIAFMLNEFAQNSRIARAHVHSLSKLTSDQIDVFKLFQILTDHATVTVDHDGIHVTYP